MVAEAALSERLVGGRFCLPEGYVPEARGEVSHVRLPKLPVGTVQLASMAFTCIL